MNIPKEIFVSHSNDYGFGQYSENENKSFNSKYHHNDVVEKQNLRIVELENKLESDNDYIMDLLEDME